MVVRRTTAIWGIMAALSFIAMYLLMYAMVDALDNVYMNFNQVWMAGLMAAPMVLIELLVMRSMYQDKRLNALFAGAAVVALVPFFLFIRRQTVIGERQFLRQCWIPFSRLISVRSVVQPYPWPGRYECSHVETNEEAISRGAHAARSSSRRDDIEHA